ncbi:MAG: transglutaminase, partial [Aquificota bacterium]
SPYRDLNQEEVWVALTGRDQLYATSTAHLLILHPPTPSYQRLATLVAPKKRRYSYVVGYKMSKESRVVLEIPPGYRIYLLPEDYSYKNDVGSLRISWKRKGREIEFHSLLILDRAFIPVRLYDQLRDLFNLTVKALKNQVLILKKAPHLTAEAMPLTSK